jgi:hypothetical protein
MLDGWKRRDSTDLRNRKILSEIGTNIELKTNISTLVGNLMLDELSTRTVSSRH